MADISDVRAMGSYGALALDSWYENREALQKIVREVDGCGPNCSNDFLRLALTSVRDIATAALGQSAEQQKGNEP